MKSGFICLGIALFLLISFGCSPKAPYGVVPIEGTATWSGKPIPEGFAIKFYSEGGQQPSTGIIKKDGRFKTIHTVDIDGVPVGKCSVHVTWNGRYGTNPPQEYVPLVKKFGFGAEGIPVEITKKDKNLKVDFPAI